MNEYYRLLLEYKGTRYSGWQIQPAASGLTVQGELNRALKAISKSSEVHSLGAGRTDAGVHAMGQVAKVKIPLKIDPNSLLRALNSYLPEDIRVLEASLSDADFMPTVHAKRKEYQYRFTTSRTTTSFQNELIANYPFALNMERMQEACKILLGQHDFSNYYCEGTEVKTNVRTIYLCEIIKVPKSEHQLFPEHYIFRIVGSGFLKQMVRLLMGTLWNIGREKISLAEFAASLDGVKRDKLGVVAPPQGLYMVCVNY